MSNNPEPVTLKPSAQKYADGLETNLYPIAKMVFSKPPGRPLTIGLQLDHEPDSGKSNERLIQEMMTLFLLSGIQIKYGEKCVLSDLTSEQIEELRDYMLSVGYEPHWDLDRDAGVVDIHFTPYSVRSM